jgi:hypothetical protein
MVTGSGRALSVGAVVVRTTGGDLSGHDHGSEEVRWANVGEARQLLSFGNHREVLDRAVREWQRLPGAVRR